jgi:hypothetical protein
MSILRGSFTNRTGNAEEPADSEGSGSTGEPEVMPGESVTAALARLRKFHKAEGEGIAISQPLHRDAAEPTQLSRSPSGFDDAPTSSMWDMDDDLDDGDDGAAPVPSREGAAPVAPVTPRRAGRVRTRLMGIEHSNGSIEDLAPTAPAASFGSPEMFAVGWLVVVGGPGRGHSFVLHPGVSQIGRGDDQAVALDFGDMTISREGHASVAYDEETRAFYLGHGGKQNIVRLNNRPVLGTETVKHGDRIRIGETTMMLAALCGDSFSWAQDQAASGPSE